MIVVTYIIAASRYIYCQEQTEPTFQIMDLFKHQLTCVQRQQLVPADNELLYF